MPSARASMRMNSKLVGRPPATVRLMPTSMLLDAPVHCSSTHWVGERICHSPASQPMSCSVTASAISRSIDTPADSLREKTCAMVKSGPAILYSVGSFPLRPDSFDPTRPANPFFQMGLYALAAHDRLPTGVADARPGGGPPPRPSDR